MVDGEAQTSEVLETSEVCSDSQRTVETSRRDVSRKRQGVWSSSWGGQAWGPCPWRCNALLAGRRAETW